MVFFRIREQPGEDGECNQAEYHGREGAALEPKYLVVVYFKTKVSQWVTVKIYK